MQYSCEAQSITGFWKTLYSDFRRLRALVYLLGNILVPFVVAYFPFTKDSAVPQFRDFAIVFALAWIGVLEIHQPKHAGFFESSLSRVRLITFWLASFILGLLAASI